MKINRILEIALCLLSLLFAVGVKSFISACGPKDDGGYMSCHWAEQGAFSFGVLLFALAVMLLLEKDGSAKRGLSMAMTPACVLCFAIPGRLIALCMMADMRCHALFEPAVHVFSAVILILALAEYAVLRKKEARG